MNLNAQWSLFLEEIITSNFFIRLLCEVYELYTIKTIFPIYKDVFRAFNLSSPSEIKVVIIGQDPYHGRLQANGLAFSVAEECKLPPSLVNIYKELVDDIRCSTPLYGNLEAWSRQGVLLMNTVLTVEESKANSHKGIGWEKFTDKVIEKLSSEFDNLVFILWGKSSQAKSNLIDNTKHLIIESPHPSPLSSYRGFFGSKPFSKTNDYLRSHKIKEIDWRLK